MVFIIKIDDDLVPSIKDRVRETNIEWAIKKLLGEFSYTSNEASNIEVMRISCISNIEVMRIS